MILIHENLSREAEYSANSLERVYPLKVTIREENLDGLLIPIPEFDGFLDSPKKLKEKFSWAKKKAVMILTGRDLYGWRKNKDEDWVFGNNEDGFNIISTARLKKEDSSPSSQLEVPFEKYIRRLESIVIHEVGHDLIGPQSKHFVDTYLINARGKSQDLGEHCPNNRCVMYQSIDIKSPSPEIEYMMIGKEKRFDGGLDEALEIMYNNWFCDLCRSAIKMDERYL